MDRIHYAGDSCVTGTAIAHALLDYSQALALANTSATVAIPTVNDDGSAGRSEFLVGPASQLVTAEVSSPHPEVVDEELVARMRGESKRLRDHGPASPVAQVGGDHSDADDVSDYDV
jgi:hypothetical protein